MSLAMFISYLSSLRQAPCGDDRPTLAAALGTLVLWAVTTYSVSSHMNKRDM